MTHLDLINPARIEKPCSYTINNPPVSILSQLQRQPHINQPANMPKASSSKKNASSSASAAHLLALSQLSIELQKLQHQVNPTTQLQQLQAMYLQAQILSLELQLLNLCLLPLARVCEAGADGRANRKREKAKGKAKTTSSKK